MMENELHEPTPQEKELAAAIVQALERRPQVSVPRDFAGRVRMQLPAQPKVRSARLAGWSISRAAGAVAVPGLLIAMCLLAPHARPSFESIAFDMELLVLIELAGIAAWLSKASSRG